METVVDTKGVLLEAKVTRTVHQEAEANRGMQVEATVTGAVQ